MTCFVGLIASPVLVTGGFQREYTLQMTTLFIDERGSKTKRSMHRWDQLPNDSNLGIWVHSRIRCEHCTMGRCRAILTAPCPSQLLSSHFYHSDCRGQTPVLSLFQRTRKWASMTMEELQPFEQIHQSSLRACFCVLTRSCTQAPSQIFCYHQSGRCETITPCVIRTAHASRDGAKG